jgi:hypothetical protein
MRTQFRGTLEILFLIILASGSMRAHPVFAKGGRGLGHVAGKSVPRPSEPSAKPALRGESSTQGQAKGDVAHDPVTRGADKPSAIDTQISVQPRLLLGRSANPNKSVAQSPYARRTLSALPRVQTPPVRNAIGLPTSPRANVGPSTRLNPNDSTGSRSIEARPLDLPG